MQTQLDQSLIDLLMFHTLDVAVYTLISTATFLTNSISTEVAYVSVFIFKVFLLMDGLCLISYAIIKYLSIFHQSILHTFSENKVTWLQRIFGLLFVIMIQAFDFESLPKSAYVSCLTGKNLTSNHRVDISTNIVYSIVAVVHLALFCRIEALNYSFEEGIMYLIFKDETFQELIKTKFFNQIFAMMSGLISVVFFIFNYYIEEIINVFTLPMSTIGYIQPMIFFQFAIVDLVLIAMINKCPKLLSRVWKELCLQFRIW